jgi:eukaryotic-like serine/threonine-protein kinase
VTRQDWNRLFELFHGTRERSGPARNVYLRQECGGDHSLMAAVEQLLLEDEEAGSFLSRPLSGLGRALGPVIAEGQQFGRYTVISLLGRGGMGEVWRGYDRDLDRPVALKFLTTGFGVDQLTREARLASALNHPGIVTVHEVLALQQTPMLVMELVEGRPLSKIPAGPEEIRNLLPLVLQISESLAAAHGTGIIHGDLKPDNIIVRPDGFVKVLDFGLARKITAENIAAGGLLAGTLIYMSPEQARGESLTPATDVYSFGLVLFELVTGRHPFGRSGMKAVEAMLRQPAPRASSVAPQTAPDWDALLEAMLQSEVAQRPTMDQVARRLRRMQQPAPSGRVWRFAAVAACLLLVVAAAFLVWSSNRSQNVAEPQWLGRPLTSDPGDELGATFSPDGTQVVYAWRPEEEAALNLFEQPLSGGIRRRLIASPTNNYGPSWSPDGRWIAYIQAEGQGGAILIFPVAGGLPRKLVGIGYIPFYGRRALDWSSDSEWVAYSDRDPTSGRSCLFVVSIRTGESRKLAHPEGTADWEEPIFSPDGMMLAFTQGRDGVSQLGLLRVTRELLPQGRPWTLQLPGFETSICQSPMWRSNGKELMFLSNKSGAGIHLWTVDVAGSERSAKAPRMIGSLGEGVFTPAVSRVGDHLIFTRRLQDKNIWRVDLSRGGPSRPVQLRSSTRQEFFPQYSPDGRRVAFESDRSGFPEIWISDANGQNAFALTDFRGPVTGSPAWSPDGREIAFDSRASGAPQVYVVSAENGAKPRRVTNSEGDNVLPVWSPDARFLYFSSNRNGDFQVWRVPSSGGPEEQVTTTFAFAPQISSDGKFLYYMASRSERSRIDRLNLISRQEETVVTKARERSFFATAHGVFYIEGINANLEAIRFWDASTKADSIVTRIEGHHAGGLSISRDGRFALIVKDDSVGADLMLVRDFR